LHNILELKFIFRVIIIYIPNCILLFSNIQLIANKYFFYPEYCKKYPKHYNTNPYLYNIFIKNGEETKPTLCFVRI